MALHRWKDKNRPYIHNVTHFPSLNTKHKWINNANVFQHSKASFASQQNTNQFYLCCVWAVVFSKCVLIQNKKRRALSKQIYLQFANDFFHSNLEIYLVCLLLLLFFFRVKICFNFFLFLLSVCFSSAQLANFKSMTVTHFYRITTFRCTFDGQPWEERKKDSVWYENKTLSFLHE